ncbi:hypothetical protein ACFE04_008375 [Oxalis oulophora]
MAGRSKAPPTATSSKAEEQDSTGFLLLYLTPLQEQVYRDLYKDWGILGKDSFLKLACCYQALFLKKPKERGIEDRLLEPGKKVYKAEVVLTTVGSLDSRDGSHTSRIRLLKRAPLPASLEISFHEREKCKPVRKKVAFSGRSPRKSVSMLRPSSAYAFSDNSFPGKFGLRKGIRGLFLSMVIWRRGIKQASSLSSFCPVEEVRDGADLLQDQFGLALGRIKVLKDVRRVLPLIEALGGMHPKPTSTYVFLPK